MQDGAKWRARTVLTILQGIIDEDLADNNYSLQVNRWENCREQGYIVSYRNKAGNQLNICWYEHRNSDNIAALRWIQNTINSPNITTMPEGVLPDKWHSDKWVNHDQYQEMAEWIRDSIVEHSKQEVIPFKR
jgi:hypothetical protein